MMSNAYFLAKFRFDTAENEPVRNFAKFLQNFAKFANFADPNPLTPPRWAPPEFDCDDWAAQLLEFDRQAVAVLAAETRRPDCEGVVPI
jgi:hypothetical protein